MGGGISQFEATNWDQVSGGVTEASATLDGKAPTSSYQVFRFKKKGLNQREFDVLDPENILLYTTRAVPGTLAWFDVLDPRKTKRGNSGEDVECLLRIHVDLSRRTWVVYRYHRPVFPGQRPATLSARDRRGLHPDTSLYKVACITVSWSRFAAVVSPFVAPPPEYLASLNYTESAPVRDLKDCFLPTLEESAMKEQTETYLQWARNPVTPQEVQGSPSVWRPHTGVFQDHMDNTSSPKPGYGMAFPLLKPNAGILASSCGCRHPQNLSPKSSLRNVSSFDQLVEATVPTPEQQAYWKAMEGMTEFYPGPFVQCQEIYNKILGNHQTSLIDKEEVSRLVQLDEATHNLELPSFHRQSSMPSLTSSKGTRSTAQTLTSSAEMDQNLALSISQCSTMTTTTTTDSRSIDDSPSGDSSWLGSLLFHGRHLHRSSSDAWDWMSRTKSRLTTGTAAAPEEEIKPPPSNHEMPPNAPTVDAGLSLQSNLNRFLVAPRTENDIYDDDETDSDETVGSFPSLLDLAEDECLVEGGLPTTAINTMDDVGEPLIGYWSWKHSFRVQQMELHLGKDSDLALHLVLAIVCNQVRYERNAVAMSM